MMIGQRQSIVSLAREFKRLAERAADLLIASSSPPSPIRNDFSNFGESLLPRLSILSSTSTGSFCCPKISMHWTPVLGGRRSG